MIDFTRKIGFEDFEWKQTNTDLYGVATNTYQLALQVVLEALGSRTLDIVAIMPVTASPEALAAVLRAGATPCLLDINPFNLQLDVAILKEAVSKCEHCVVITSGDNVSSSIRDFLVEQDIIEICDTRHTINPFVATEPKATFEIYDLAPLIGAGGFIVSKYQDIMDDIKMVRSGILGHAGHVSPKMSTFLQKRIFMHDVYVQNRKNYEQDHGLRLITDFRYPLLITESADRVIAHLHSYGVSATRGCVPLHKIDSIKDRWEATPSYPVAEELFGKVTALPVGYRMTHSEIKNILLACKELK